MARGRSVRLAPEWDRRFTRMVGVSAVGHVVALMALVFFATRSPPPPLPLVAYTVEITDPNALGGRLPPGAPAKDLSGGATKPAAPEPPAPPAEAAPKASLPEQIAKTPPAPPVEETPPPQPPVTGPATPTPAPQPPPTVATKEPEPAPVVEKKAEPPPKPEPPKTPPSTVPPKAATAPPPPPPAKPETKAPPKPVEPPKTAARPEARPPSPGQSAAGAAGAAPAKDAYAAAAERWRSHAGGGLGGAQEGSGPVGSGGDGRGGGGQLVGIEFLAYRQRVIDTIKSHWTNVILRPGLVASVRFVIAPDGEVSDIRLAQSSNNAAYDASVMRAVQQVDQLPPPPSRYVNDFREFQIEFHSEETGSRGAG